jgi:hypothetical protein
MDSRTEAAFTTAIDRESRLHGAKTRYNIWLHEVTFILGSYLSW